MAVGLSGIRSRITRLLGGLTGMLFVNLDPAAAPCAHPGSRAHGQRGRETGPATTWLGAGTACPERAAGGCR